MPMIGRKKAMASLRGRLDKVLQLSVAEATKRVTERNPIDTGRSAANWEVAVGTPKRSADYSRREADIIPQYRSNLEAVREADVGNKVYLTNGIHYVQYLEGLAGAPTSPKAPQGIYRITAVEMKPIIRRLIRQVSRQPIVSVG